MKQNHPKIPECEFHKTADAITLTLKGNPDAGSFTCTDVLPGVYFAFNDIRSRYWPAYSQGTRNANYLTINICLDGRCETALSDGKYAIVSAGQLAIGTQQPQTMFYYPTERYRGVEFFLDLDIVCKPGTDDYLSRSGVRISEILQKFRCEEQLFFCTAPEDILRLADFILKNRFAHDADSLRLYATLLLRRMQDINSSPDHLEHFTKTQIQIARDAERDLCEDLSVRISAKEFADRYGISETGFKNYFKGVFGESFSAYAKRKRMELAADLLRHTDRRVIDISIQAGYENQGKFAGVFKSYTGMSPLEYRRMCRLADSDESRLRL